MTDSAKFGLELEDGVSQASKSASAALAKLREGLDRNQKELASMNSAMRELRKAGDTESEGYKKLKEQIEKKTKVIGEYRAKYVELGGTFRKVKPPTKEMNAFQKVAEGVPGPIGEIAGKLGGLGKFLAAGLIVAGVVAIGVALVGLAAAAVTAGAGLVMYGIRQADAHRNELLRLEGLTRLRRGMHATGESATAMQAAIDRVSDSSSASRSTLEGYAARLHRLGLRGDNFTAALEGMATRGEVLGDRYAQSFAGMAAATARAGGSVRNLANAVQHRLGDIAGKKLIALDVTMQKLRDNLGSLFRNVKIEGFLRLFREFASTFSQARVTGRALAGIFERLFAPLDRGAENSTSSLRRFMTQLVTTIVRVENNFVRLQIAGLEAWRALNDRGIEVYAVLDKIKAGLAAVGNRALLAGLGTVLAGVLITTLLLGAAVAVLAVPFMAAAAVGYMLGRGLLWAVETGVTAVRKLKRAWEAFDFNETVGNWIDGIVTGITSGTGRVMAAVVMMAARTTTALRDALQIKSPSRVFARLGREIPRGLAVGVDAGAESANASIANMIEVATGDVSATAPRAAAVSAGSQVHISIGDLQFTSPATTTAAAVQDFKRQLIEVLDGLVVARGEPAT